MIIVASVSCIYGLGSPEDYQAMMVRAAAGRSDRPRRDALKLVDIQYERNDTSFGRGNFRVRGDVIELYPAYEECVYRIELFGDEVEALADHQSAHRRNDRAAARSCTSIRPSTSSLPEERIEAAVGGIGQELESGSAEFKDQGKLLEAQRLEARTRFDIEMLQRGRLLPGHRELRRAASRPGARRAALYADRLISRRTS